MNTKAPPEARLPEVTLLIGSGCSFCPVVLDAFARLMKEDRIGRLEVINVTLHPQEAAKRGVRTVPWMAIGAYHLEGAHTYGELLKWVDSAVDPGGDAKYLQHLLETGRIEPVIEKAREQTENRKALAELIASPETPMNVRIGIGVVFEELSHEGMLGDLVDELVELTRSGDLRLRADACHYLGLTRSNAAMPRLREILRHEEDPYVREIALESLDELQAGLNAG